MNTSIDHISAMKMRIQTALGTPSIKQMALKDFTLTFTKLGLKNDKAENMAMEVIQRLKSSTNIIQTEQEIFAWFRTVLVDGKPLTSILDERMSGRAEIILKQITPYFEEVSKDSKVVDFGCGDGQVTQLIADTFGLKNIVGYDVRLYPFPGVTVPIKPIEGHKTDAYDGEFDVALLTNVAHHEAENQKLLLELSRIIKKGGRLVVIETVPTKDTIEAFEINFLNDYFYNRLFHQADVPVPGTYELATGWLKRFSSVGFELDPEVIPNMVELGYDQPTIQDWHVLYVFKKVI